MSAYTDVGRSDDDEGCLLAALAGESQPVAAAAPESALVIRMFKSPFKQQ